YDASGCRNGSIKTPPVCVQFYLTTSVPSLLFLKELAQPPRNIFAINKNNSSEKVAMGIDPAFDRTWLRP
ncbi:hypothetical protein, partial [Shewanella frigidimarina]|uniref:hypothetical protein n=1 Tax=Shewanella frigidimarina TaxID=56812 RepID=UPI003F9F9C28